MDLREQLIFPEDPSHEFDHLDDPEMVTSTPALGDNLYIETLTELEIAKSAPRCSELARFMREQYGIDDFDAIVDRHFPKVGGLELALLPRQVMMPSTETVMAVVLCEMLDLEPCLGGFTTDTYHVASLDKTAALKTTTGYWFRTRAGTLVQEFEKKVLSSEPLAQLGGRILDSICTEEGEAVSELHRRGLTDLFGVDLVRDCSGFFTDVLLAARNKPERVFIRSDDHRSVEVATSEVDLARMNPRDIRPPAKWYYPIMFSLFVDKLFLLETYENPRGSVSAARELFVQTSDMIREATGRRPRVIQVPPLSKEMLFQNRHVLTDGTTAIGVLSLQCREEFERRVSQGEVRIPDLAANFAQRVLEYGKADL